MTKKKKTLEVFISYIRATWKVTWMKFVNHGIHRGMCCFFAKSSGMVAIIYTEIDEACQGRANIQYL